MRHAKFAHFGLVCRIKGLCMPQSLSEAEDWEPYRIETAVIRGVVVVRGKLVQTVVHILPRLVIRQQETLALSRM